MRLARLATPLLFVLLLGTGFIAGAGTMETIHRTESISYEKAIEILDTDIGQDSQVTILAQQRLKALVGIACATLARQAASDTKLGADARRFLIALREQLGR